MTGTVQCYQADDFPHCPDCGRRVELPLHMVDGALTPAPTGHDSDGPLFTVACEAGHLWTYQPYEPSDLSDEWDHVRN